MVEIRRSNGAVVSSGRNLRVLRDAVSKHAVEHITISRGANHGGILHVLFATTRTYGDKLSGAACTTEFASYTVLCEWVARWRNVQDVPLTVPEREYASVREYANEQLQLAYQQGDR